MAFDSLTQYNSLLYLILNRLFINISAIKAAMVYKFCYAFFVNPDPNEKHLRLQFTTDEQEECFLNNYFEGMCIGQAAQEAGIWSATGSAILDIYLAIDSYSMYRS